MCLSVSMLVWVHLDKDIYSTQTCSISCRRSDSELCECRRLLEMSKRWTCEAQTWYTTRYLLFCFVSARRQRARTNIYNTTRSLDNLNVPIHHPQIPRREYKCSLPSSYESAEFIPLRYQLGVLMFIFAFFFSFFLFRSGLSGLFLRFSTPAKQINDGHRAGVSYWISCPRCTSRTLFTADN